MKVIEKMSGKKIVRADTSGEELAEKQIKKHEDRLVELRIKAVLHLRGLGVVKDVEITQVGDSGFHWRAIGEGQVIPTFEQWSLNTVLANLEIF